MGFYIGWFLFFGFVYVIGLIIRKLLEDPKSNENPFTIRRRIHDEVMERRKQEIIRG